MKATSGGSAEWWSGRTLQRCALVTDRRRKGDEMVMCLDDFGNVSVEVRRESFILHTDDAEAHHEFPLSDLDDLIAALKDARRYLVEKRGWTP